MLEHSGNIQLKVYHLHMDTKIEELVYKNPIDDP
jgi:hypothetical protein